MEKHDDADLIFYPAFCFKASPTHFAWVKMALADVHKLHRPEGFNGMNTLLSLLWQHCSLLNHISLLLA
jgi:hypothetical protein